jgi:hypothetical protein
MLALAKILCTRYSRLTYACDAHGVGILTDYISIDVAFEGQLSERENVQLP